MANQGISNRNRDLRLIHVGAKELAMTRESYEDMLWAIARVRSAGDLDSYGRQKVIQHLKSRGFKPRRKGRSKPAEGRELMVRKVRALLINHPTGAKPDGYADGMAKQMFAVDRFEWLKPDQMHKLIQSLEVDRQRRSK
jgi:phage gp16-like protein